MPKHNLENDDKLENEVDNIGMVHLRKHTSETEILPGYGTTNFGVSAYESESRVSAKSALLVTGLASAGILAWKFGETLINYGLLMRESARSK